MSVTARQGIVLATLLVIVSLALAYYFSPWWLLLALFVGLNLLQSSFTGLCPLALLLRKLGLQPGCAFPK